MITLLMSSTFVAFNANASTDNNSTNSIENTSSNETILVAKWQDSAHPNSAQVFKGKSALAGGNVVPGNSKVTSIAQNTSGGDVYVGTSRRGVWVCNTNCTSWQQVGKTPLSSNVTNGVLTEIVVDKNGNVYAAINGSKIGTFSSQVWKCTVSGTSCTWAKLGKIPNNDMIFALALDKSNNIRAGVVNMAATPELPYDMIKYDGTSWVDSRCGVSMEFNLPVAAVINENNNDIYIGFNNGNILSCGATASSWASIGNPIPTPYINNSANLNNIAVSFHSNTLYAGINFVGPLTNPAIYPVYDNSATAAGNAWNETVSSDTPASGGNNGGNGAGLMTLDQDDNVYIYNSYKVWKSTSNGWIDSGYGLSDNSNGSITAMVPYITN